MSVLNRIAHFQGRRDEAPNEELARELAWDQDKGGIQEIAQNLWNENQNIRSDCLKVLDEIGYLAPELIGDYVGDFLKLLKSKNNRMVWGSMAALSSISVIRADEIYLHVGEIQRLLEVGSVITKDGAVRTLAGVASSKDTYRRAIFPNLLELLRTCRPKDVPRYAESIVVSVDPSTKDDFIRVLEGRMGEMKPSQASRLKKVVRKVEGRA